MNDYDKEAEELKIEIEDNKYKKRNVREGRLVGDSGVTFRERIGDNLDEIKKFRDDKRIQQDKLGALKARYEDL